eukprot:GHVQ01015596.1.p1 GENE.GHVQ01015596.1~~GHVQ01015596.1.p1  ORF type:complete len:307 (+),score=14.52 GHVQ01015596.1:463-1383(+)
MVYCGHWLPDGYDAASSKYSSFWHPFLVLLGSIAVSTTTTEVFALGSSKSFVFQCSSNERIAFGSFLLAYWAGLMIARVVSDGWIMFYDGVWACNIAIVIAAIGIFMDQTTVVGSMICFIAVDQVLWYFDVVGYLVCGKFYIGVAKYLTWNETTTAKRLMCSHHLWFIPYCGLLLKMYAGGLELASLTPSVATTSVLVCFSRIVVPYEMDFHVHSQSTTDLPTKPELQRREKELSGRTSSQCTSKCKKIYMNMNLSHANWKDVQGVNFLKWMNIFDHREWYVFLPWQLLIWNATNCLLFLMLMLIF